MYIYNSIYKGTYKDEITPTMKKILTLFLLLNSILIFSQNDCSDAIEVCGNDGYQDLTAESFEALRNRKGNFSLLRR